MMTVRNSLVRPSVLARLAVLLVAGLLAAACGSSGSGGGNAGGGSTHTGSPAASSGTVISTRSGPDGTYLTSASGRSVYLFAKDTMNTSTCSGACAGVWPPVTAHGALTASGSAVKADLGTITRSNGAKQVTYKGHPLYYFSGDTGAGMTKGQGINGFGAKWWLVAPSGNAVTSAGPTPSPAKSTGGSSWA
jgi:predicted lipoprotein with Yx(FWY)xxD motif